MADSVHALLDLTLWLKPTRSKSSTNCRFLMGFQFLVLDLFLKHVLILDDVFKKAATKQLPP